MATIPRYDESQVQPGVLPTPQRSGGSPVAQGLGQVGQAIGGAGQEAMRAAIEAKSKADSSSVMEAQVSLNKKVLDLQTAALQRQGHDALNNKPLYDQFDQVYKEHQGLLKNDTQRQMFAHQTANDRNQFSLSLERHAAEQGHALAVTNSAALVQTDMQKLSTLYRDPQSFDQQLKVAQAHKLDWLHVQGLSDSDEAAQAQLAKLKSDAYVDRIRQMMVENPAEAQHLYEVHQDEIEAHEREQLKHTVSVATDERTGIDAAEALTPDILKGQKTYTEMRAQLYSQLKERPNAFKIAEQQLRGNYQAAKEDRAERVGDLGSKVETAMVSAVAAGRALTPKHLAALPEYQALLKEGSKEAINEASRFMHQSQMQQKEDERERKAEVREARADRREREHEIKLSQDEWTAAHDDPDQLLAAQESDIRKLAPKIGYRNVDHLLKKRREYLEDDQKLQTAKIDKDAMVSEMTAAGLTYQVNPAKAKTDDYQQTAKLKARVQELMRYEAERTRKQVDPERQKEIIREQMVKVHVRAKRWGMQTEDEKMGFETEFPENWVVDGATADEVKTVVSAFKSRGVAPSYEMVHEGVKHLKGGRI